MAAQISTKTTIKVNLALFLFLLIGGIGISLYQYQHTQKLVDLHEKLLEDEVLHRGIILSQIGSRTLSRVIEEAIDNTSYTLDDFFDTDYKEIPGFSPAKYHNKVDSYFDKAILTLEDEFLKDDDLLYAIATDRKGYVPTHNSRFQQPITGNVDQDRIGNRTKRLFDDTIGLTAAQNMEEGFRQKYVGDDGKIVWDISSPIIVKGKHWGAFRVGVSLNTLEKEKQLVREKSEEDARHFSMTLSAIMLITVLLSLVLVFVVIKRTLIPLKDLTATANQLADGKLDAPITNNRNDELGELADVLERLRLSLKKAIERLQKR